jgi:hypothetical protein
MKIIVGILVGAASVAFSSGAQAKLCSKHTGASEKACVKQLKRDRIDWPPSPKEWEIKRRVGAYNWNKAARVANCETGGTRGATRNRGNLNWYPNGTFQGPLGMFRSTAAYGKRKTGYYSPDTWAEWVAVAVASHSITGGWSGWGCRGA